MDDLEARLREAIFRMQELKSTIRQLEDRLAQAEQTVSMIRQAPNL